MSSTRLIALPVLLLTLAFVFFPLLRQESPDDSDKPHIKAERATETIAVMNGVRLLPVSDDVVPLLSPEAAVARVLDDSPSGYILESQAVIKVIFGEYQRVIALGDQSIREIQASRESATSDHVVVDDFMRDEGDGELAYFISPAERVPCSHFDLDPDELSSRGLPTDCDLLLIVSAETGEQMWDMWSLNIYCDQRPFDELCLLQAISNQAHTGLFRATP